MLRTALAISFVVAAIRIADCWLLVWLNQTGRGSILQLPLVLLLYPEGSLMQVAGPWTTQHYIVLSVMLVVGSTIIGTIAAAMIWCMKRAIRQLE